MSYKVKISAHQLTLYQNLPNTLANGFLMAICCMGFGSVFIQFSEDDLFPRIFGLIFIFAGLFVLASLPKYYHRMKDEEGAVLFKADLHGLSISPPFLTLPSQYDWHSIKKILLCSKHVEKGLEDGTSYSWNVMLIYFNDHPDNKINFIQRSQKQISVSPEKLNYTSVSIPKHELQLITEKLKELSENKIEILNCQKVKFDFNKSTELIID